MLAHVPDMFAASLQTAAAPHCALVARMLRVTLAAIALFLVESRAFAEDELTLTWSVPEGDDSCPDQAWVMQRVAEQLGREPARGVTHGVNAIATIERRPDGYVLTLHSHREDAQGSRTLEGRRCEDVSEAAALVLALSVSEAAEQAAALDPSASPEPALAPSPPPEPEPKPNPARTPLDFSVRADVAVDVGLWSRASFGPSLAVAVTRGVWRAELGGVWFPPVTLDAEGRRLDASLGAARAAGCALFGQARVRGGGCAGAELGRVSADNADSGVKDHAAWSAAFLQGRLGVRLFSRLSLVVRSELLVALQGPRFSSVNAQDGQRDTLYESRRVQLRAALGPELRF